MYMHFVRMIYSCTPLHKILYVPYLSSEHVGTGEPPLSHGSEHLPTDTCLWAPRHDDDDDTGDTTEIARARHRHGQSSTAAQRIQSKKTPCDVIRFTSVMRDLTNALTLTASFLSLLDYYIACNDLLFLGKGQRRRLESGEWWRQTQHTAGIYNASTAGITGWPELDITCTTLGAHSKVAIVA